MPGAPSATSCAFAKSPGVRECLERRKAPANIPKDAKRPRMSRKTQGAREDTEKCKVPANVPKGAGRSRRRRKMQGARKRREAAADSTTS